MENYKLSSEEFNKKYRLNKNFIEQLVLSQNSKSVNSIAGKPKILALEVLKRFFTNPIVVIATIVFVAVLLTGIIVTYTSPYLPGRRIDANWEEKGYKITGTTSVRLIPPTFSPFTETRDIGIIDNITRFTNPNYPFYPYLKDYLVEGTDWKSLTRDGTLYSINYYKYWYAMTLNGQLSAYVKEHGNILNNAIVNEIKTDVIDPVRLRTYFGTTSSGVDAWTTVWAGTLESIWIALFVATAETILGVAIGAILGFHTGKWIDTIFMRLIEIFQAPPSIIWLLMFVSIWGTNVWVLIAGLLFVGWTYPIGTTRLFIITVKDEEYIVAAKSTGASTTRQIFSHALPAIVGKISQSYVRRIPSVILSLASLAFLGFYNDPNSYNLGKFMFENVQDSGQNPWLLILPALILLSISLSLQFISLGLHDALDPKVIKTKK